MSTDLFRSTLVAGLFVLLQGQLHAQFSPGELTSSHASLEGINHCTSCHELGKKIDGNKCLECHNPNKIKGKLLMDSAVALLKGGDTGPGLVTGKPDESEIIKRVVLPKDHDDIMPPKAARSQPKTWNSSSAGSPKVPSGPKVW